MQGLFYQFSDILDDDLREQAKALFYRERGKCSDNMELVELRHDIIKGYLKPTPSAYD